MNRTEPLQRTARNRPVNRTVPSTCTVFLCITGGTRASTGVSALSGTNLYSGPAPPTLLIAYCFSEEATNGGRQRQHMLCIPLHCRGRAGEYRFSALSGFKCSKALTPPRPRPSIPNPAYCFSEEATNVGFLPIQRRHKLCIPLHCRGRAGEYRFSTLSGPRCSKTCTPPRPRPSTPNPAHCFSEEVTKVIRFPSHHTETAHDLYSPALPRARGGVQVFTFRPQMFQNQYSPAPAAQHPPQPCSLLL